MPPSTPSRGPLTTRVIQELEGSGFPVGDNNAPTVPYGWQGEPDEADNTFIPWLTCTPGGGQAQRTPGALADTGTEWVFNYSVFYAGLSRKQTEALADRLRAQLCDITREAVTTDTGNWRIMKISCSSVGSSNRVGSAYPDYFTQSDNFDVWISKER